MYFLKIKIMDPVTSHKPSVRSACGAWTKLLNFFFVASRQEVPKALVGYLSITKTHM